MNSNKMINKFKSKNYKIQKRKKNNLDYHIGESKINKYI